MLINARALALNPALDVGQYAHTRWTLRENEFTAYPKSFAQTADGYLWLGNEFGLIRFDGVRFTPWLPPAGAHLPDHFVVKLLASHDGSLWIGTRRGLSRWSRGALTHIDDLANEYVSALLEDRDGSVWVGTSGGLSGSARLCVIAKTVTCDRDPALGRFVSALHEDTAGRIWVGAATGLWRWKPRASRPYTAPHDSPEVLSIATGDSEALLVATNRGIKQLVGDTLEPSTLQASAPPLKPTVLFRDRDDSMWIGTQDQGLLHVHQGRVDRFTRSDGLSADFVLDVFEDREGTVWVATLNGLDRFREYAVVTMSTKQGLATDSVLSVAASTDGRVWFGTVSGLNRWKDGEITRYRPQAGFPADVGSLFHDTRGRLWVSSTRGLLYVDRAGVTSVRGVPNRRVQAIVEDRDQNLWISDQDHGLLRVRDGTTVDSISSSQWNGAMVWALAGDPARSGVWLGFFQGGVSYFEAGRVQLSYGTANGLGTGAVTALFFDGNGILWVSTQGGLSRVKDGRVATLNRRNGLPCDAVHWAIADNNGAFWLYTTCGLVRIVKRHIDVWSRDPAYQVPTTVYNISDGVPTYSDLGSYSPKVTKTPDGRLWFTTYAGVAVVDPQRVPYNTVRPPVHVERVIADRQAYDPSSPLELPPGIRDVRIDYTALSLAAPEKIRFRYKLEGRDRDWVDAGNRREAFYTDLPPQPYHFRILASNNDGVWNEEGAVIEFAIRPSFYETRAFNIAVVLSLAGSLWALYRMRIRRLATQLNMRFEERLAERTRIAQELHDTLLQGSLSVSMQLHVIAEEVSDQPVRLKLDRILKRFGQVIEEGRQTVQELRSAPLTGDDLEHALVRDAEDLRGEQVVDIRVAVEGRRQPIQPLIRDDVYRIIREALANAFRHGRATRVDLEFEYGSDSLRVTAWDDGCGMEPGIANAGRSGHWGIQGMRERAEQIGATLKLSSRVRNGTEVELVVPARVAYQRPWPRRRIGWFTRILRRFSKRSATK